MWRLPYRRDDGRAPLLAVLGAYLGIAADEVRLDEGPHGRPGLAAGHRADIDFNWSHSGQAALVAVARGAAPGIDLEHLRPRPQALRIARRYFTEAEVARLAALGDEAARERVFLALWTAKEAVLKALGRGIAFGLNRLEVAGGYDGGELRLLALAGDDASRWQLHALAIDADHVAALAWRGGPRRVRALAAPPHWAHC